MMFRSHGVGDEPIRSKEVLLIRNSSLAFLGVFAAVALLALSTSVVAQSASDEWQVPRTVDGRPDLAGVWANNVATPLERPDELTGKTTFTGEELADLKESAVRLFGGADDASFGDGVFQAVLADGEGNVSRDGGTGNYSSVWMVDRVFESRTSLITDPANGKLPSLTPAAEQRQADQLAQRKLHPYDGPENLSLQARCITYGIPGWEVSAPATTATTRFSRPPTTSSCSGR